MALVAIETSCDECSVAVLDVPAPSDQFVHVRSNVTFTQIDLHRPFGGIVPEIASRNHLEMVNPVLEEALNKAGIGFKDIEAVAVTSRPGLIGALLVGVSAAKVLAYTLNVPLVSVDHLDGHLHSVFIANQSGVKNLSSGNLPLLTCLVSGGHTNLYLIKNLPPFALEAEKLAESRDDAAGEAFDKCAKLMGLPYPGGRYIDELAKKGDAKAFAFPRPMPGKQILDFSFSGLKTAMSQQLTALGYTPHVFGEPDSSKLPQGEVLHNLCASVQEAIVESLVKRIVLALERTGAQGLAIVGGVSANSRFRAMLHQKVKVPVFVPNLEYCTDNGAMIGAAGAFQWKRGDVLSKTDLLKLNAASG